MLKRSLVVLFAMYLLGINLAKATEIDGKRVGVVDGAPAACWSDAKTYHNLMNPATYPNDEPRILRPLYRW